MELNNTYVISNKSIDLLLDDIRVFTKDFVTFAEKHDGYSYSIDIFQNPNRKKKNLWSAEIVMKNEKQEDKKTLKGVIEPPTLL